MEEQRNERLWRIARKRAGFKQNLYSYVVVNLVLWVIWWLTQGRHGRGSDLPWPVWVMVFWGIGLLFNYLEAYKQGDKQSMAEEEYEKLMREKEGMK
jgi:hypothetical protein